jgi:hypothetical protein
MNAPVLWIAGRLAGSVDCRADKACHGCMPVDCTCNTVTHIGTVTFDADVRWVQATATGAAAAAEAS